MVFTRKAAIFQSISWQFCLGFFTTVDSQTHHSGPESSLKAELIKWKHVAALLLLFDRRLRLAEVHCLRKLCHVVGKFKGEHHETPELWDLNQLLSDGYRTTCLLINLLLNITPLSAGFKSKANYCFSEFQTPLVFVATSCNVMPLPSWYFIVTELRKLTFAYLHVCGHRHVFNGLLSEEPLRQ